MSKHDSNEQTLFPGSETSVPTGSKLPYHAPALVRLGDVATITKAEYGDLTSAKYGDLFGSRTI